MTGAAPDPRRRTRRVLLVVLIAFWLGAFVSTHTPRDPVPGPPHFDKWMHSLGYFLLGCMLWLTLGAYGRSGARRAVIVLAALSAYGVVDELTQPWAGRTADLVDWLADVVGAGLAVAVMAPTARVLAARRRAASRPEPADGNRGR